MRSATFASTIVLVVLFAACRAVDASDPATERRAVADGGAETMPGMAPGEKCVGCQPVLAPPEKPATAYRFEVDFWEMPLARAESLYRAGDRDASGIALQIDEKDLGATLRELEESGLVRHLAPSTCDAAAGTRVLVPKAFAGWDRGSTWSEGLRFEIGAAPTTGWSPHQLDFACVWTSPQGERLASAAGRTPLAPDLGVVVWCLPSKTLADAPEPRTAPAVVVLVRIVPRS